MHWILISGSWRAINKQVIKDINQTVTQIIQKGHGIVTGGALGVDHHVTQKVTNLNPQLNQLQVIIPAQLNLYLQHYQKRAKEGIITIAQAQQLTNQLQHIKTTNPKSLIELNHSTINQKAYYHRNSIQIQTADELIAFHINQSQGVQDVINKAQTKNIPIKIHRYTI